MARPCERDEREASEAGERGREETDGRAVTVVGLGMDHLRERQRIWRWSQQAANRMQQRHHMQWRRRVAGDSVAGGAPELSWSALTGCAAGSRL